MTYGFRLRFDLAAGHRINADSEALTMRPAGGCEFELRSASGGSVGEASSLAIRSGGYPHEEAAKTTGQRVKDALLLTSATANLGVDLGQDRATGGLARGIREEIRKEHGGDMQPDVHGLVIFPEDQEVGFLRFQATATIATSAGRISNEFSKHYGYANAMTNRQRLAGELISLHYFESGVRAKLVTLMTALEVLSKRECREPQYQDAIADLVEQVDGAQYPPEVTQVLRNGLGNLRRQSVKSACVEVATSFLGDDAGKCVSQMYDLRSRIVHEGEGVSADDLGNDVSQLRMFVTEILISSLRSPPPPGAGGR